MHVLKFASRQHRLLHSHQVCLKFQPLGVWLSRARIWAFQPPDPCGFFLLIQAQEKTWTRDLNMQGFSHTLTTHITHIQNLENDNTLTKTASSNVLRSYVVLQQLLTGCF